MVLDWHCFRFDEPKRAVTAGAQVSIVIPFWGIAAKLGILLPLWLTPGDSIVVGGNL
jgi:hypothetical protein